MHPRKPRKIGLGLQESTLGSLSVIKGEIIC